MDDEGQLRLVSCRSRKLLPAERNYPVYEKEMLALVYSLKHWRHYVLGTSIKVRTENSALRYVQKAPKPSSLQARWLKALQEFTLEIEHIPGTTNTAADALSRLAMFTFTGEAICLPMIPRSPVAD